MEDFFAKLFSPDGFVPRWTCGDWTPFTGWLSIGSNVAVFLAYSSIAFGLRFIVRRRKDLPTPFLLTLFSWFIFWCGVTHLMEAVIFYYPLYRVSTLITTVTALVSAFTAAYLMPLMPRLLTLPGPAEYQAQIEALAKAEKEARHATRDLQQQLLYRTLLEKELQVMRDLQAARNHAEVQRSVEKLDEICAELRGMMPPQYRGVGEARQPAPEERKEESAPAAGPSISTPA